MVAADRLQHTIFEKLTLSPRAVLLTMAFATGVVLRCWVYRSALGVPNSDEAVNGLMAMHAQHGELTTFLWGQPYGGSQESLFTVPLFWLFGPSWFLLRIVPMLFAAAAAVLVWRVGRRTIGHRAAWVAAALLWVWPPYLLY